MNEEPSSSDFGLSYQNSETSIKCVDLNSAFKCNVLDVYSVPKLPTIRSFGDVFNDCFRRTSEMKLMNISDFSDISSTNSSISSVDNIPCTVPCLESYEELKNTCQTLGLKFIDCSKDIQAEESSNNLVSLKYPSVRCLFKYEELQEKCETLGLQFVDCSLLGIQAEESFGNLVSLKNPTVRCLFTYEELQEKCKALGLQFVDCSLLDKIFEVDLILGDKLEEGQKYYFVKWQNYDLNTNTWEPDYHLFANCLDMITYYESIKRSEKNFNKNLFCYFVKELLSRRPCDVLSLVKLLCIVTGASEDKIKRDFSSTKQKKMKVREFMYYPFCRIDNLKKELWKLMRFAEERKPVLINLQEWEYEINAFNPATYVEVENNVDLETAPTDFEFIHDYVSNGIEFAEEPAVFCKCDNCHESKKTCCANDSDANFAYNRFGRNQLLPGYPIYECNKRCKCGNDCLNRVVQHGPKIKVAIFRTSNGCGWGLKTLETIQKDQFVLEYLGEILTSDEAEIRGKEYDSVGRSYLFDLDYADCKYTVDAGRVGNASHFINHSCEPNLHVFAVWINCQDPQLPRLAFFAKKKIRRGQELTFDYKMNMNKDKLQPPTPATGTMLCKCNSRKCRTYLC